MNIKFVIILVVAVFCQGHAFPFLESIINKAAHDSSVLRGFTTEGSLTETLDLLKEAVATLSQTDVDQTAAALGLSLSGDDFHEREAINAQTVAKLNELIEYFNNEAQKNEIEDLRHIFGEIKNKISAASTGLAVKVLAIVSEITRKVVGLKNAVTARVAEEVEKKIAIGKELENNVIALKNVVTARVAGEVGKIAAETNGLPELATQKLAAFEALIGKILESKLQELDSAEEEKVMAVLATTAKEAH